jgi:broad specificity phosphatase PhoE
MRLLTAVLAASLCAGFAPPQAAPVYVTRHYDTPAGERDPDLLPAGKARAERLAKWFKGKKLKAIYVTDFKRTRQTVEPLVKARGIAVQIYDPRDETIETLADAAGDAPVLIVGHSNTVPDLVEGLGAKRPADLKHEDFGDLWTVRGGKAKHVKIEP